MFLPARCKVFRLAFNFKVYSFEKRCFPRSETKGRQLILEEASWIFFFYRFFACLEFLKTSWEIASFSGLKSTWGSSNRGKVKIWRFWNIRDIRRWPDILIEGTRAREDFYREIFFSVPGAISINQYFAEHFVGGVTIPRMDSKLSRHPLSYLNARLPWNHPPRRTRDSCDIFQNENCAADVCEGLAYSSSLDVSR